MNNPIRRVVTGHSSSGKSIVLFDGPLEGGAVPHDRYVWTAAVDAVDLNDAGDGAKAAHRLEPAVGQSIFRVVEFPPESVTADMSHEQKNAFFASLFESMGASHCRVDTTRSPGMHRTQSLDYVVVLRGEVTLLLDESEVTLHPGDLVVQRSTNHDWVVRGNEPALIAVVMIGVLLE